MKTATRPALLELVEGLDRAVDAADEETVCRGVEDALASAIRSGTQLIPPSWHEPCADHYARRLLHRDPRLRYTVICMTWGAGQGTPLHDHGDSWGVVGVYAGRLRVAPYDLVGRADDDRWRFEVREPVDAERGALSSVIPPGDHHTIENPFGRTAISIHVYKGEMRTAGIYLPTGQRGSYRRVVKTLGYDAD